MKIKTDFQPFQLNQFASMSLHVFFYLKSWYDNYLSHNSYMSIR